MTNTIENKNNHLLRDLFPYDIKNIKNAALRKALKEYAFFLTALSEACHHFQCGDLQKFDALVSENACQIRAIKIAILASKKNINFSYLSHQVLIVQEKISSILEESTLARLMIRGITLEEILDSEQLDINLTHEQLFLLQSFLLCEMKELGAKGNFLPALILKDKSAPKKLKKFGFEVSVTFTNDVVNKTRRRIANTSINFVRKSASHLEDHSLINMTSNNFTLEYNMLPCLPMFWTYKTLLKTAQNESIPLVAHIQFIKEHETGYKILEEELLFFKIIENENGSNYVETSQEMIDINTPACVIQGIVKVDLNSQSFDKDAWKERISNHSIIDIILAGAADHKQYPTQDNDILIDDLEYERYRSIAKNHGFSIDNPKTFFINHVFSMQVGRAYNLIKTYPLLTQNSAC